MRSFTRQERRFGTIAEAFHGAFGLSPGRAFAALAPFGPLCSFGPLGPFRAIWTVRPLCSFGALGSFRPIRAIRAIRAFNALRPVGSFWPVGSFGAIAIIGAGFATACLIAIAAVDLAWPIGPAAAVAATIVAIGIAIAAILAPILAPILTTIWAPLVATVLSALALHIGAGAGIAAFAIAFAAIAGVHLAIAVAIFIVHFWLIGEALLKHRRRGHRLQGADDPEIVLGVLEIAFGHHAVARGVRVPGELHIFFIDVSGRPADLHVRTGAFEMTVRRGMVSAGFATTATLTLHGVSYLFAFRRLP